MVDIINKLSSVLSKQDLRRDPKMTNTITTANTQNRRHSTPALNGNVVQTSDYFANVRQRNTYRGTDTRRNLV